jgi:alpha-D-ribose 1-methylphosphonate 5-phosphate C-P lyase|tara:strand:+ start:137 stop:427 length:291 start_codon:yes stop_codon:yes gene_type:complete
MSDGNSIKIPTWALPIGAAIVSGAIAWGSMQAQASATADEVAEIKVKVEEADTTGKLNAQAIEQITQSLAQMNETARDSDAKLQTLIELMIKQAAN